MHEETVLEVKEVKEGLIALYGPYLRRQDIAEIYDTSTSSLGNTMRRSDKPSVVFLRRSRIRLGRRSRYPAENVAMAIVLDDDELEQLMQEKNEGRIKHDD